MICDILIIGGDGDLAFRKLYPALYHLDLDSCLPSCLRIVSVSRNSASAEGFADKVRSLLLKHKDGEAVDEAAWKRFSARLQHMAINATSEAELARLRTHVFTDTSRDLIVYLATPPAIFAPICQSLWAVGLVRDNMRIVIEKPLGHDRESFLQINNSLAALFDEDQVYRIDHYLGKETVQNLLAMRFANALFEPLWNSNYIDHVQITAAETVGAEGRWQFYDEAGALRDMVQNHLLQLLCLVAMEPPASLAPWAVHDEKLKVLRSLAPMSKRDVHDNTVRGQYVAGNNGGQAVPGYTQEEGAKASGSLTETFVAIKAEINNWRWAGVPFYLRTGKRMQKRFSEIVVQFNEVPHAIFGDQMRSGTANRLVIRLQPEEGIRLHLLNKVPGLDDAMPLEVVSLNLSLSDVFTHRRVPDAYERLLLDVMRGNSTLFMRADQVEAAWQWVDGIAAGWHAGKQRPMPYVAGSWGPSESIALIARDGRNWQE
ncbi:MAG: glucose-6-phosphate dehydrogenase [Gammaproteobacteria bacterium]|nr:glucose-6-phosphate dehydrogenase [Gammaproteobacteria bacterium]MDP2349088.1 glucose-6-phosphate dehydrogenase [Gammaproteobacteria bacterium]